jgi:DNA helicase-2/ATP-dependent DNA helicase PcrA
VKELGYGHAVHHVLRRIAEHTRATGRNCRDSRASTRSSTRSFYLPLADKPAWEPCSSAPRTLVDTYLQDHPDDLKRVWEVERPFELHLEHANVTGRADVILDREDGVDGGLAIVDYKTRRVDPRRHDTGLQLQVYTAAGRGEGFDVRAAWLHDLTARGNTARVHIPVDNGTVAAARDTVDTLAAGVRQCRFDPSPGDYCKHCDVREICRHRGA